MDRFLSDRVERLDELYDLGMYPVSSDDLIDRYGALSIEYPTGPGETLADVLSRGGPETYADPEEAIAAILNGVGADAVGRPRYSDRDPPVLGGDEARSDPVSF